MTKSTQPGTWVRVVNGLAAVAFAAFVLVNHWPIVKLFGLARADLQYQGEWIGGHAKRITAGAPGGVADCAGLKPGDVLETHPVIGKYPRFVALLKRMGLEGEEKGAGIERGRQRGRLDGSGEPSGEGFCRELVGA